MSEKIYKTPSQRFNTLRYRDMEISTSSHRHVLNQYNYYNLINGYKDSFLFTNNPEKYKIKKLPDGTSIKTTPNQPEALYKFDDALRKKLLEYLLKIEEQLKSILTQAFYEAQSKNINIPYANRKNLHLDNEYLRGCYFDLDVRCGQSYQNRNVIRNTIMHDIVLKNFYFGGDVEPLFYNSSGRKTSQGVKFRKVDKGQYYDSLKSVVYSTLAKQKSKSESLERYSSKHGYVPMRMLMSFLILGNISKFYLFQTKEVKRDILKRLKFIEETTDEVDFEIISLNLSRSLEISTIYGNIYTHNERVYNNSVSIPLDDSFTDFGEKFPSYYEARPPQQMSQSKLVARRNPRKKVFALFFSIPNFLNRREISKFKNETETQFSLLEAKLSVIIIDEIRILIGLNFDWKSNL